MKKIILAVLYTLYFITSSYAQNVDDVMKNVISQYANAKNISADFHITSTQMNEKGTIVMNNDKFRILSDDYKCWYNGKTQWVYTSVTGEVNIIEPTAEELELTNPYLAVLSFKKQYKPTLKSKNNLEFQVQLNSVIKSSDIRQIVLTIQKKEYKIIKAIVTLTDGSIQTIKFSNYRRNINVGSKTFVFDRRLVPIGTQLNDLR